MSKRAWHQRYRKTPRWERTSREGFVFASKAELGRWQVLQRLLFAGEIKNLRRQVRYSLVLPDGTPVLTPTGKTASYTADFVYEELQGQDWVEIVEDYKGYVNDGSQLRIALFEAIYKKQVRRTS